MKRTVVIAIVVLALAILTKSAASHPTPNPAGTFSFAAMGDAPYYWWEDLRFRILLRELDAHDLRFIVHVGDIFWHPCSDAMYLKVRKRFDQSRHPVVYTPGDNEWSDCWERGSGSYAPLERLTRIRQIFFSDRPRMPLSRQQELSENSRWRHENIVFATVHLTGSANSMKPFPSRSAADDTAAKHRTEADVVWMRAAFAEAKRTNARALVIAFHGAPFEDDRDPFEPFLSALEDEVRHFNRPVLAVHGDDHEYTVDHPLRDAPNFTRLEVPGSPDVGFVRVFVKPDPAAPFAFEKHVVPRFKFW